jgi:flagellar biosynthesis protein FlhF
MKIKRFVAATMREALASVRAEQGPDAVILSNRRIDGGIELITAVDYDEALIEEALARAKPAPEPAPPAFPLDPPRARFALDPPAAPAAPPAPTGRRTTASAAAELARALIERAEGAAVAPPPKAPARGTARASATRPAEVAGRAVAADRAAAGQARPPRAPEPAPRAAAPPPPADPPAASPAPAEAAGPRIVWSQDPEIVSMRREVAGLRKLLEDQLASLAWSDRLRREPVRAAVLRGLTRLGLAPDVARALAARVPEGATAGEAGKLPLALLMKHVPTVDDRLLATGGTFAVVGPTGVGKTTTIAKLAARFALAHGAREVALVSLDHYRIGARDQLLTFARILGVPMHVATSGRELAHVLAGIGERKLVLIDTAGMSPRDERLATQFAMLSAPAARRPIRTLLTLAANAEHLALDEIARSYATARPEAILLTKLDEAASLGPALSVAIRRKLPLAQLCDGQRVPQDLHAAPAKRVWLVKSAWKLAERAGAAAEADDDYMAEHFGRVARHG